MNARVTLIGWAALLMSLTPTPVRADFFADARKTFTSDIPHFFQDDIPCFFGGQPTSGTKKSCRSPDNSAKSAPNNSTTQNKDGLPSSDPSNNSTQK